MEFKESTLEGMVVNKSFWDNKTVLVTGQTGFKGGWLSMWLSSLGAKVSGLALDPITDPNLYFVGKIREFVDSDLRVDIRNLEDVLNAFKFLKPEIVFHMSAQAIVRQSYKEPLYTFETNALGSAHVLEAIRQTSSVKVGVMVTTDKVYRNHEWTYPYREIDALGGDDPYSASKTCAEIIIDSYRKSFLQHKSISSVRAGNVIGGGDWGVDRLIPDAMRSFSSGKSLILRNSKSIRPWQYILDALHGYILLAEHQWNDPEKYAKAWNFAPHTDGELTVERVSETLSKFWGDGANIEIKPENNAPNESGFLNLDSSLARMELGWKQEYPILNALQNTVDWYKAFEKKADMQVFSLNQIEEYERKIG